MASSKKIVTMICLTLISLAAVGCSDDATAPDTRINIDTAPPAVPANLDVMFSSDTGAATVSWAPNTTDSDLAGFIVNRDYYGDEELLGGVPANSSSFSDDAPKMGTSTYSVYSIDLSGNASAVATVVLVRTGSHGASHDLLQ